MKFLLPLLLSINTYALTNSTAEENTYFDNVIFIKNEAPDSKNETFPSYCNATLLKSNMAITAAHCIQFMAISKMNLMTIELGKYKYKTMADGTVRKIGYMPTEKFETKVTIELSNKLQQKFDRNNYKTKIGPNEDVAIIYWEKRNSNLEFFPKIVTPKELQAISKNLLSYSPKVVSINPFSEMSSDYKRSAILNNLKFTMTNYFESKSNSRVQEGDSGSPLFVKIGNETKVLGVVKGLASTVFSNWDAYASVSQIACEINERLPAEFTLPECSL